MSAVGYRIPDEPTPGGLARVVVDPFWPLLAVMITGAWFGLAWLAFNGFALGSPTRWRELAYCVGGVVLAIALFFLLGYAISAGWIGKDVARYLALTLIACKLGSAYLACFLQQRSLELYEYYGGTKLNGLPVVLLSAFVLRPALTSAMADSAWRYILF